MISNQDKSNEVESRFQKWLDKNSVPYWYIQQDIKTFSPALKKYMTKRPDFMVLIPHVGFILVDAEYKSPAKDFPYFFIDKKETEEYCNLQNFFNLQVWYVFADERDYFSTWRWIPASKVLEIGNKEGFRKNKNLEEYYGTIPLEKFIQIQDSSGNIGNLFSEMPKFY